LQQDRWADKTRLRNPCNTRGSLGSRRLHTWKTDWGASARDM